MKKITLLAAAFAISFGMHSQTVLDEDFESGVFPPTGWTQTDTHPDAGSNWHLEAETSGNSFAEVVYTDAQLMDEWLITPSMDLTTISDAHLTFRTFMSFNWMVTEAGADLMVKVSTDGGTNWTQEWVEEDYGQFDNFTWFDVTVPLTAYDNESDVMIAFHYLGDDGAQVRIDDVVVMEGTLSIVDANINGFNYFYSPQTKELALTANNSFSNINVFNVLGQEVINQKLSATNEVVNLSSLKNGVYIANVTANGQITTFKLIKR